MPEKMLTFRQRRLAAILKRIRETETTYSLDQAADDLGYKGSTLSRYENAKTPVKPVHVRGLLAFYGVDAERIDALANYARVASKEEWWAPQPQGAVPEWFGEYLTLEEDAKVLDAYQPLVVHGLLQTEDYARAVCEATPGNVEVEQRIEVRKRRQERLHEGRFALNVVFDESVLQRQIGDLSVLMRQIEHLLDVTKLPNVQFQILPLEAGRAAIGEFAIVDFPSTAYPPVVCIENECGCFMLEGRDGTRHYQRVMSNLQATALSPTASRTRLRKLLKE